MNNFWTLSESLELIKKIENIASMNGAHIALTGGLLYKDGPRKDLDIIFYRIRQEDYIDEKTIINDLATIDIIVGEFHGWLWKATYKGKNIDLFFPENYPDVMNESSEYGIR